MSDGGIMTSDTGGQIVHGEQGFGSAGFVRFMRTLSALALLVAIGGAVVLTLQATADPESAGLEFAAGYGPGVLLLEPAGEAGPDPFTAPVAVDLGIDQAVLAYPPLDPDRFADPHRRGSEADLLVAGGFGRALVERRDEAGGRLTIDGIRALAAEVLGLSGTLSDLDDVNRDGFDDDGSFTLRASDGSAACVTPGSRRTLAIAQGHQIDAEDRAAVHGLTWSPDGPCGTRSAPSASTSRRTGGTPGTFGGTRSGEVCDVGLLVSSLQANPHVAAGWATVHGIPAERIPEFVAGLTPVVLLRDTGVTNYGWHNGRIVPRQSVLQRGTTVLVDRRGSPAVRCLSGGPLRPPQPLPATPSLQGEAWAGFGLEYVEEVVPADGDVSEFVLVDLGTGAPLRRAPGSPGSLASLAGPIHAVGG